ncbi:LLM class flavin-dependent oxidoreductase [Acetobacter senegalensis]|uniref:LLM class flavin-dependent oxidoreductase n=1 Tax=Acetobacter senegalensis TaxID=446692 RepID=UPI001EDB7107|nr:LLM class flavin-dependent oxidoreductase [Acetobacter senegalensis]MCG4260936.1 LLM class flavin-dependent oxidoreductase [Acetobacter senegalensis]
MTNPFKLGFLTHVSADAEPQITYNNLISLFVAAENLGYESGWIAQHHLSRGTGLSPSPLLLLSAIAAHTQHIHLATGITVLPFEDPIRLGEDATVLNSLSDKRVQLGLGSGGANIVSFPAFNVEYEKRSDIFVSKLNVLQNQFKNSPLADAQDLRKKLWHSHSTLEGAVLAAHQGNGFLLGTAVHNPATVQKPLAETYLNTWDNIDEKPRLGIIRAVFPATDRQTAQRELAADLKPFREWLKREKLAAGEISTADIIDKLNVHHGNVDDITSSLQKDPCLFGYLTDFIVVVQSASSTIDDAIRRLEIIANEIVSNFGWKSLYSGQ